MFILFFKLKPQIPSNRKLKYLIRRNNINNIDIEKIIDYTDKLLWDLKFHLHTKGSTYLKTAICLSLVNHDFLYNQKKLLKVLSDFYNTTPKNIRNCIDNSMNTAFKYELIDYHINYFEVYYKGEKFSLKYFLFFITGYIEIKMK